MVTLITPLTYRFSSLWMTKRTQYDQQQKQLTEVNFSKKTWGQWGRSEAWLSWLLISYFDSKPLRPQWATAALSAQIQPQKERQKTKIAKQQNLKDWPALLCTTETTSVTTPAVSVIQASENLSAEIKYRCGRRQVHELWRCNKAGEHQIHLNYCQTQSAICHS